MATDEQFEAELNRQGAAIQAWIEEAVRLGRTVPPPTEVVV